MEYSVQYSMAFIPYKNDIFVVRSVDRQQNNEVHAICKDWYEKIIITHAISIYGYKIWNQPIIASQMAPWQTNNSIPIFLLDITIKLTSLRSA